MPAPSQTVFDGFQSCRHPIPAGLSYQHEPAVAIFPADVREPEEVERFWFAFPLMARFSAAKRPNSIRRVFSG